MGMGAGAGEGAGKPAALGAGGGAGRGAGFGAGTDAGTTGPGRASGGPIYVKPFSTVPVWPSGFFTTMFTVPMPCGGVVTTIAVLVMDVTVAGRPSKVTVVPDWNALPPSRTVAPPVIAVVYTTLYL